MRGPRQESMVDKIYRYRGVIFVISVPIVLISFVLLLMPRSLEDSATTGADPFELQTLRSGPTPSKRFSVIFDAGSSGSRVHVFAFDKDTELIPMEDGSLELFLQRKPGLSNYSNNPVQAAESLKWLLQPALDLVPRNLWGATPVRLGATAGLRLLPGDSATEILDQVRYLFANSGFRFQQDWVTILGGSQEGAYQWVTINYLLGNLGKSFDQTVGVVDLGGGSVQMSYAVSEETHKTAPKSVEGSEAYIVTLKLLGQTYYLYVYSYLRYGLYAVRGEILKQVKNTHPCLNEGFDGYYSYGGDQHKAVAGPDGAHIKSCKATILAALRKDDACASMQCTFGGIWSGGGGDGRKKLLVASFFFDRALEAGIIKDAAAIEATIKAVDFEKAALRVCSKNIDDVSTAYSISPADAPYFCMDLLYQYVLLVEGFGVGRDEHITLVKKVKYHGAPVEAAWALGMAIESVS